MAKPGFNRGVLRRLRWNLAILIIVYFFAGAASQKLIPGVDEIFPFYGWSLFTKVPNDTVTYTVVILEQNGTVMEPPEAFLGAPDSIVKGNRYIARKVIQKLGRALDRGQQEDARQRRELLEDNYFHGRVRYELFFERSNPLETWKSGEVSERRRVGAFDSGAGE